MIREGRQAHYVGEEHDGVVLGDVGTVLSRSGCAAHVLWSAGQRSGEVTLEDAADLVAAADRRRQGGAGVFDDSLTTPVVSVAARDTYDAAGSEGVLNALVEAGHLAAFTQIAEQAMEFVATQIRSDPAFASVLGQLEPDEGDALVVLTTATLLRDAFGDGDG